MEVISKYSLQWSYSQRFTRPALLSLKRKQYDIASLCNSEVLTLLNELKDNAQYSCNTGNHFATILYEASHYLQNLQGGQTDENARKLLTDLLDFPVRLTFREKLMIVNTPPKTALELSLILHNYDERLTEVEVEQLLAIIEKYSQ